MGLGVTAITRILGCVITDAGLEGYTAKDFPSTGTTTAMHAGIHEAAVMRVGWWRSADVSYHVFSCFIMYSHVSSYMYNQCY